MPVPPTQVTLLGRLRDPADERAWQTFEGRYRELIVRFSINQGLQFTDAEDTAQAVLTALLRSMRTFAFDPKKGRFRDYLFRAVRNEISRQKAKARRPKDLLAGVSISDGTAADESSAANPELERAFEDEWMQHHFRLAMTTVRETHSAESLAIFERLIAGESVASTAQRFATTEQAVHKVKQRLRDRLRELIQQQWRTRASDLARTERGRVRAPRSCGR